jgi:ubiquinone/menaquinone biosynthesis C-methylase UbiE
MDEKQRIIEMWRTAGSADYAYFDAFEQHVGGFWEPASIYRQWFDRLDLSSVLEIACGKGRHSQQIVDRSARIIMCDTSEDAIAAAKERFAKYPNVSCYFVQDGQSLPFLDDETVSAVFSYDAMVHFEALTVNAYLNEISRVLRPGGKALLHHSNYSANPSQSFEKNPGWRNFMSLPTFNYFASRAGLMVVDQVPITWAEPDSDALTLLEKPPRGR